MIKAKDLLRHRPSLAGLVQRLVADPSETEALDQSNGSAVPERPPGQADSPRGWFATGIHSQRVEPARPHGGREYAQGRFAPATGERFTERKARHRLAAALDGLSPVHREVLELWYFHGLAPRRIATQLGLSVEAVRTRSEQAVEELRASMDAAYGGDRQSWSRAILLAAQRHLSPTVPSAAAVGVAALLPVALALIAILAALLTFRSGEGPRSAEVLAQDTQLEPEIEVVHGSPLLSKRESTPPRYGEGGTLFIAVHWKDTGEPVGPAGVSIRREGEGSDRVERGTTDNMGTVEFEDLVPGLWRITADLGPPQWTEVADGKPTQIRLDVDRPAPARGVLTYENGGPLMGATIFASRRSDPQRMREVATTDSRGEFVISAIESDSWIGTHCQHRRSHPANPGGPHDPRASRHRLAFREHRASELDLRVTDSSGADVADAEVTIAYLSSGEALARPDGELTTNSAPLRFHCDWANRLTQDDLDSDISSSFRHCAQNNFEFRAPHKGPSLDVQLPEPLRFPTGLRVTAIGEQGEEVFCRTFHLPAGRRSIQVDLDVLERGTYELRASCLAAGRRYQGRSELTTGPRGAGDLEATPLVLVDHGVEAPKRTRTQF